MTTKEIIEIIMASIMGLTLIGVFVKTIIQKKGIGARVIQFICIVFLIPTIIILSFEDIIPTSTVGTLLGGLAGYVLSGISNYDSTDKNISNNKKDPQ